MRWYSGIAIVCFAAVIVAANAMGSSSRGTMAEIVFDGIGDDVAWADEVVDTESDNIEESVPLDRLWDDDEDGAELRVRFVRGILRSRQIELANGKREIEWEECGEKVAAEDYYRRASEWAVAIIDSINSVREQSGVELNPWGVFATAANEGSFNACALDYVTRRWASKNVTGKMSLTYSREDVWKIVHDKGFRKGNVEWVDKNGVRRSFRVRNRFDGGPFQIRTRVGDLSREQFDALLSVNPGVYIGVREMARRSIEGARRLGMKRPHPRPWQLWPGIVSQHVSNEYDRRITSVARWLGAKRGEV